MMTARTTVYRSAVLRALLVGAISLLSALFHWEITMAEDRLAAPQAIRLAYLGPQDKPVPPLLLTAQPIEDPPALFAELGLSHAEARFGTLTVPVSDATMAALSALTPPADAGQEPRLSISLIELGSPTASTVGLDAKAAGAYLSAVRDAMGGSPEQSTVDGWIARTNLVPS